MFLLFSKLVPAPKIHNHDFGQPLRLDDLPTKDGGHTAIMVSRCGGCEVLGLWPGNFELCTEEVQQEFRKSVLQQGFSDLIPISQ